MSATEKERKWNQNFYQIATRIKSLNLMITSKNPLASTDGTSSPSYTSAARIDMNFSCCLRCYQSTPMSMNSQPAFMWMAVIQSISQLSRLGGTPRPTTPRPTAR